MNTRTFSVVVFASLLTLTSGCGGVRNFLFGRGARCGLCQKGTPQFGNTMQAPAPYGPAAAPTCQTPPYQAPSWNHGVATAPSAGCGCNDYAGSTCGQCQSNTYGSAYGGSCGCGVFGGYENVVADPYMSGQVVNGTVYGGGQIISDTVVGGPTVGGQVYPSPPVQNDNFQARKFDSDGNRILWEEPISQGGNEL